MPARRESTGNPFSPEPPGGGGPLPQSDFSLAARAKNIRALAGRKFDVLVLGAGINGAAIACELAQQGLAVALIDKGDFASATSQSSGNLIWGGIKYLEQGRLRLVARLCAERDHFVARAPHCVRERRFLAPCFRGDPHGLTALAWGARLHWALGGFRRSHRPEILRTPDAVLAVAPHLRPDGLAGGVLYTDAQIVTSDAHLTFEIVRTAAAHGATVANYVEATAFGSDGAHRAGVECVDRATGRPLSIAANLMVNAAGIWADRVDAESGWTGAAHRLVLRRGTFLHLRPEDFEAPPAGACVVVQARDGRRPFFIYPWGPVVMVGTTDLDHDPAALDDIRSTPDEFVFLFRELRDKFRLKPGVDAGRVVETRVGVRPLAARRDADPRRLAGEEALALSRDHAIDLDARRRWMTVRGGKFTPARRIAEETAFSIARHFPDVWGGRPCRDTRRVPVLAARGLGDPAAFAAILREEAASLGLDARLADPLLTHHGAGARDVLARVRADRALGERVYPDLPYLWAEVRAHAEGSMVTSLDDLLRRRTNLAQWVPFGGFGARGEHAATVRRVAEEICRANGWEEGRAGALVEEYRRVVERRNAWRGADGFISP